ncbi:MAG TPA: alpha-hydroxy acid oxidase [Acetobacteraceae bacterium]|nr:alpha-hydroxy acid oxidase [Acetobacteraceae bacterium]
MAAESLTVEPPFARAEKAAESLPLRHARRLRRILDLDDFQRVARRHLPRAIHGYVANGSEDETSLATNRAAFLDYRLVPRVLVGVGERDQRTTLLGRHCAAPFGIAPMGGSAAVTYDGDVRMARAAAQCGIPFVLSGNSIIPMEEVARNCPGAWFASYQSPTTKAIEGMVERVAAAGFSTFVSTVDVPVGSNREKDRRAGFTQPIRLNPKLIRDGLAHPNWVVSTAARTLLKRGVPRIENLEYDGGPSLFSRTVTKIAAHAELCWDHVRLIRRLWKGPFVVKGILSREDARIARDHGVDGIVVSNHGGRQLDRAASPLHVLPDIVGAAGDMTVMIDSGFRRGTDVLTALALGADFVFIGRPFLFAAAVAGEAGVLHAIDLLSKEIDRDMALLGLRRIGELGRDSVLDLKQVGSGVARAEPARDEPGQR